MAKTEIIVGNSLDVLRGMESESVHCAITSPPYWGLRKYAGVEPVIWGGESDCEHQWVKFLRDGISGGTKSEKVQIKGRDNLKVVSPTEQAFCQVCEAWRGCLGLEPTPELYIGHLVRIFREIKRVLRKDGTVWLNLGDSYAGNRGNTSQKPGYDNKAAGKNGANFYHKGAGVPIGLKPKDLCGIPWRVVFALQANGWWLSLTSSGPKKIRCQSQFVIVRRNHMNTCSY